jgi:hypothetical protein
MAAERCHPNLRFGEIAFLMSVTPHSSRGTAAPDPGRILTPGISILSLASKNSSTVSVGAHDLFIIRAVREE